MPILANYQDYQWDNGEITPVRKFILQRLYPSKLSKLYKAYFKVAAPINMHRHTSTRFTLPKPGEFELEKAQVIVARKFGKGVYCFCPFVLANQATIRKRKWQRWRRGYLFQKPFGYFHVSPKGRIYQIRRS